MDVYDDEPADTAVKIICLNCDRPAISKINGTAGHGHDHHPCPWCNATLLDVNKPEGYDYSKWFMINPVYRLVLLMSQYFI